MSFSFLHFIRWIETFILSHFYVKWSNSRRLLRFFQNFIFVIYSLLFSVCHPYHQRLIIPLILGKSHGIFHLMSLPLTIFWYSLSCFFLTFLSFILGSFRLWSRWNFYWLKPNTACSSVFTWLCPALRRWITCCRLLYQSHSALLNLES